MQRHWKYFLNCFLSNFGFSSIRFLSILVLCAIQDELIELSPHIIDYNPPLQLFIAYFVFMSQMCLHFLRGLTSLIFSEVLLYHSHSVKLFLFINSSKLLSNEEKVFFFSDWDLVVDSHFETLSLDKGIWTCC